MTDLQPATYRDNTIANQPTPSRKTTTGKTISLTVAETRVLTLLPTYRTLAAIGNQLGIGRPTVKTHVANIYKKLGATKRDEAVKLAQSAGLLPDRSPVTPAGSAPGGAHVETLERLAALRDRGAITDEEFAAEKTHIMNNGT